MTKQENNDNKFTTALLLTEIKSTMKSVPLLDECSVSIDGDYSSYNDVVNRINVMVNNKLKRKNIEIPVIV